MIESINIRYWFKAYPSSELVTPYMSELFSNGTKSDRQSINQLLKPDIQYFISLINKCRHVVYCIMRSGCEPRSLRTSVVKTGINCSTTKLTSRFSGLTNKQISRDACKCDSFKNFHCLMAISVIIGQNLQPSHRQSLWWCRNMSEQLSRGTRTPD